jgi:diaminopimelate decarboxylase
VFLPELLTARALEIAGESPARDIFYSLKANPSNAVLRRLAALGFGADVSTAWELELAIAAGFPLSQISCVGPWKPPRLLRQIAELPLRRVSVESVPEARAIASLRNNATIPELFVRWLPPPRIRAATAENMATAASQFGLLTEEILDLAGHVPVDGIHLYAGSDIQDVTEATQALDVFTASPFASLPIQFGPGLGISYELDQPDPSWKRLLSATSTLRPSGSTYLELGRYLVAHSTALLATVQVVKEREGQRICIMDAGMACFARTVLTGSRHSVVSLDSPVEYDAMAVNNDIRLVGPSCTPLDVIRARCYFSEVKPGDTLAILACGAYGANLALHGFMGLPPASTIDYDTLAS